MHYGLLFDIEEEYKYDKHWYYDFDITICPPWDLSSPSKSGLFPHPPAISELKDRDAKALYRNTLSIDTINTLNEALCELHLRRCSPSSELVRECERVQKIANEVVEALNKHHPPPCKDDQVGMQYVLLCT